MREIADGFLRPDGKKGIRNKLLVIYTVDCAWHVAVRIREDLAKRGWDADVVGQRSCQEHAVRTAILKAYCRHPNVGAVLVVGHGCESTGAEELRDAARDSGRPADCFFIQEAGGTEKSISLGISMAGQLWRQMEESARRTPFYVEDLVIAGKCGGSDFSSGLVANPLIGLLFDRMVEQGATCLFAEANEAIGLREELVARGVDELARAQLGRVYDKAEESCRMANQFFIRPGNIQGGLTTIEEKSMSSYAKSGHAPIQGVLKIAHSPSRKGLWLFDELPDEYYPYRLPHEGNPGGDAAILMLLNSAGCHLNFLITGRGHTCGTGIAPTIKVTANEAVYERMKRDIDFSAGAVLRGEETLAAAGGRLEELMYGACAGAPTWADRLDHRENEIWSIPQEMCGRGE